MKYLFFRDANKDYGAQITKVRIGALMMAVGMYEDADAKKILKNHKGSVSEIDYAQYEELLEKKTQSVTGRVFKTQPQDATRNPNAVYAEKENKSPKSPKAKDLVSVGDAIVDNPLKGSD
jgi:hypothetical protein